MCASSILKSQSSTRCVSLIPMRTLSRLFLLALFSSNAGFVHLRMFASSALLLIRNTLLKVDQEELCTFCDKILDCVVACYSSTSPTQAVHFCSSSCVAQVEQRYVICYRHTLLMVALTFLGTNRIMEVSVVCSANHVCLPVLIR